MYSVTISKFRKNLFIFSPNSNQSALNLIIASFNSSFLKLISWLFSSVSLLNSYLVPCPKFSFTSSSFILVFS